MRVLIISEHYFPVRGGSTTYVYNLCKSLSNIGCEVYLVTIPDDINTTLKWYKDDNFHIYCLDIPKRLRKERYFPIFLTFKIGEILEDVKPEIIHYAHGFFVPIVTKFNQKMREKPTIWTIQNVPPYEHRFNLFNYIKPLNGVLEKNYLFISKLYGRFALKLFDYEYLICVSEKTAKLAIEGGVPSNKVRVIPDGVDIDFFTPKRDISKTKQELGLQECTPIILTVAGIISHKGLDYLVKVIPRVLKKYPDALFLIIGPVRSKSYFQDLTGLINELKTGDNVKIIPGVDPSEINKYYTVCDIYVQPSLEEGFCMSILEAMACRKPVIGTRTGAIPNFINESKGGILIDPASSEQIYGAVIGLLSDQEKMEVMGKRSREYVLNKYSWNEIAKETMELYEKLIEH